jgi:hypothetical protein
MEDFSLYDRILGLSTHLKQGPPKFKAGLPTSQSIYTLRYTMQGLYVQNEKFCLVY